MVFHIPTGEGTSAARAMLRNEPNMIYVAAKNIAGRFMIVPSRELSSGGAIYLRSLHRFLRAK
jgi:hypothetical protein